MATFTFGRGHNFPSGTTVSAYLDLGQKAQGAPPGNIPATTSAVVATNGDLVFTGLTESTRYYAVGLVGGVNRWVAFQVPSLTINDLAAHEADTSNVHGVTDMRRIAVLEEAPLNLHWPEFGGVGDGSTNNDAALLAAVAKAQTAVAVSNKGSEIVIPPGIHNFTALDLRKEGINIRGMGGGGPFPVSELRYVGTGARGIDCRSAQMVNFHELAITYNNAGFVGNLVDYNHNGVGASDAARCGMYHCMVGFPVYDRGGVVRTADKLVDLQESIFFTARDSYFSCGQWGIKGMTTPGYSNSHTIDNCGFDHLLVAAIGNMGQRCSITNCDFERTFSSGGRLARMYYDDRDAADNFTYNLLIENCWAGDGGDVAVWIEFLNQQVGLALINNFIANQDAVPCVKFKRGFHGEIRSNCLSGQFPIEFVSNDAASGKIEGNTGFSDQLVKNIENQPKLNVAGNGMRDQSNFGGPDQLYLSGAHIITGKESIDGSPFTSAAKSVGATVEAALGTGGAPGVSASAGQSNDMRQSIRLRSGATGMTTGDLAMITYARPFQNNLILGEGPAPVFSCANPEAADLRPYIRIEQSNPEGWTRYHIGCRVAPPANTDLWFHVWVAS